MERLKTNQDKGLTAAGVRKFALVFLVLGIVGRSVLQNRFLGMSDGSAQLLDTLMNMPDGMLIATLALIIQLVETCAVPLFCFLLVEGVVHTSDFMKYLTRLAILAVAAEIPYNLAYSGKLLDIGSRNPAFGLVLSMVMIYFYQRYADKSAKNIFIKVLVTLAAFVWTAMLGIEHGNCCVLIVAVLWAFRAKPIYRNIAGCSATVVCTVFSMFYLAAPMSFLIIHFYNGEKGESSRKLDYLAYPVALAVIGIASMLLF